jgi:membrane-associated phospholipid phosphatase
VHKRAMSVPWSHGESRTSYIQHVRALAVIVIVASLGAGTRTAHADDACTDKDMIVDPHPCPLFSSKRRVAHLAITVGAGGLYLLSEAAFKSKLAPQDCRWCNPTSFDLDVRNKVVWSDTENAALLSNLTGYVAAPVAAITLIVIGTLDTSESNTKAARIVDHLLPVIETVAVSQIGVQIVKFAVGRQRPYAHFAPAGSPTSNEDNLSFFSGHSALTFALVTSAGVVAHKYELSTEPYIWAIGAPLAVTTAYLRLAADRHYITDVLTGSAVGVVAGLLIPRWSMPERMHITPNGVAWEW